jgi:hypothetical protein
VTEETIMARIIVIDGHVGNDTGYTTVESDGSVVHYPGNRAEFDELKHALQILKHATQIKDHGLQKVLSKAAGEYVLIQQASVPYGVNQRTGEMDGSPDHIGNMWFFGA